MVRRGLMVRRLEVELYWAESVDVEFFECLNGVERGLMVRRFIFLN